MSDLSYLYADGFDTEQAAEGGSGGFEPVPKGQYRVTVAGAETRPTKAGNGDMLKVRLDIVGPQHAGRVVFDDILIKHPSEDAQRIGRERFASLCRAAGLKNPKETSELVGKEVEAFIKVETSKDYGDQNRVGFYSLVAPSGGFTVGAVDADFDDSDVVPF